MGKILISVIIPTYKRPKMLLRSLKSVLNQTYKNFEVLIIDDNPSESKERKETENFMQNFLYDSRVKYIKHFQNSGACSSRNTGISNSIGEVISFLDDDDEYLPNKLYEVYNIFKKNKGNLITTSNYNLIFENRKLLKKRVIKIKGFKKDILNYENILVENFIGSNSFVSVSSKLIKQLKGFDESLKSCQDWDMWIRILKEKSKLIIIDKPLVNYYIHSEERITTSNIKRLEGHLKIYFKNLNNIEALKASLKYKIEFRLGKEYIASKDNVNALKFFKKSFETKKTLKSFKHIFALQRLRFFGVEG